MASSVVRRALRRDARRLRIEATRVQLEAEATEAFARALEEIEQMEVTDEVMARVLGQVEVDRRDPPPRP